MRNRHASGGIAALAVGVLALAAAAALPPQAKAEEVTVTIALASDVPSLDPTLDTSPIGQNVRLNIYDQLTTVAPDGSTEPKLAESWQVSEDGRVWTFTLRSDATFHDGSPVTVDDVIWTYDTIRADETSPVRAYLSKVESIERLSDSQLRITLIEPWAPFDRQVALISITSQAAYETMGAAAFGRAPVGSGPYRLVEWVKDDRIVMQANPDYWGGAPDIDTIVLRPIPADASRASALISGEVDIVPLLPPQLAEGLAARDGLDIIEVPSHRVVYLGFNVGNGILGDADFRRAVDYAIDREAITNQLLRGLGEPIGQLVAPVTFGHDPTIAPTPFDPDRARRHLELSGYAGETITLQFPNNNVASNNAVAQAVAGFLTEVGIDVQLQGMEYTAFFPLWLNRQLGGMNMFSFGPTNLDADLPLTSLYETGRTRGYWEDPETDAMVRAQRAEADPDARRALISAIWRKTRDEVIYSTLYNEVHVWGVNERITVSPRADGIVRLTEIGVTGE